MWSPERFVGVVERGIFIHSEATSKRLAVELLAHVDEIRADRAVCARLTATIRPAIPVLREEYRSRVSTRTRRELVSLWTQALVALQRP